MAHAPLITRAELLRYAGGEAGFLDQFDVRAIQVTADTGGALGTATFKWRFLGDSTWSAVRASSSLAPWSWSPAGTFAVLSFAAGTYTTTATYTIDEEGTVTRSGAGPDTLTATRFDPVEDEIQAISNEATDAMQPRYTPPLLSWGESIKKNAALWVRWRLKDHVGLAPSENNTGDANIIAMGQGAETFFRRQGAGQTKSAEVTDSSSAGTGAGLMVQIASDDKAGWD
jgi:hypothetical protein